MACKCGSNRIMFIQAHCRDCFNMSYENMDYDGYVLADIGIGSGDDVCLDICLDCGQIQDWRPVTDEVLQEVIESKRYYPKRS